VNDSGFWLVSRFFGLSTAQTLRSWTVMTTVVGVLGFLIAVVLYALASMG
jgi:GntP family gluconate:H+ symporter